MPSDNRRTDRVAEAIRTEVATFLNEGAKDPRLVGLVTVTCVEVTRDLRHAKVFVSVLGTEEEAESTLQGMNAARSYLRRELSHRLNTMHHVPEIAFKRDRSIERGAQMSPVLDELAREREAREAEHGG